MLTVNRLDDWFSHRLDNVNVSFETKAYIVGVLSQRIDIITDSIVLEYVAAANDFERLQKIGDSTLFTSIIHHEFVQRHIDVNYAIAKMSYHRCYQMLNRECHAYEELATKFHIIVDEVKCALST